MKPATGRILKTDLFRIGTEQRYETPSIPNASPANGLAHPHRFDGRLHVVGSNHIRPADHGEGLGGLRADQPLPRRLDTRDRSNKPLSRNTDGPTGGPRLLSTSIRLNISRL